MSKCPKGHDTPPEFQAGIQIRCPVIVNGLNCDEIYTVGAQPPFNAYRQPLPTFQQPTYQQPGTTRRIG